MVDVGDAVVRSWTLLPWIGATLIITSLVYLRGFRLLQATRPEQFPAWRAFAFLAGLVSIWIALASPLDAMGGFLLTAHMVQHFILMSVAPPLILLGYPAVPMLRGLPRPLVRDGLGPYFSMGWVRGVQNFLTHPAFGWLAMNIAYIGWHIPAAYELTLRSQSWHEVEHACFFLTSIAFWWNVVQPWPFKPRFSRWTVLFYLVSADLVNTGLSASLAFSGKLFYPTYAAVPRISGLSPMNDQIAAGAFMWVIGSVVFLVPAIGITVTLLAPRKFVTRRPSLHILQPVRKSSSRFDLLRTPVIGAWLRSRYGRMSLQSASLVIAAIVITHGLTGHQMGSMNLAGVVPWNYVRAGGVVALILFGNLFCMACPFMLPRELGHRLGLATHAWPNWLRNKWLALALIVIFFWGYERFSLWDAPLLTAWLLIAYFAAAFFVDTFFRGASFCKYVCPIGQFNFVSSLFSPTELTVRSQSICASCETKDCIRGNETQRGCELDLFLPQKVGNLDCTLCMDCVKACPHDNVAIYAMSPMREIARDPLRSSIRRLSLRVDIAMVMLAVVAAAFLNAAVMVQPGASFLSELGSGVPSKLQPAVSLAGAFLVGGVIAAIIWLLAHLMRRKMSGVLGTRQVFCRFVLSLMPLGLGMWAAHLLFHFFTTWQSAWSLLQQFASDSGSQWLGHPPGRRPCRAHRVNPCSRATVLAGRWAAAKFVRCVAVGKADAIVNFCCFADGVAVGSRCDCTIRVRLLDIAAADADARHGHDRMKRRLFLVLILISICTTCFADGGRLRFSKPAGPFQVTLFTSPEPLTPGPADFSVMVQDGVSNQVLPDADIQMKITASDGRVVQAHASAGAATNKLLQAAAVTLPTTGIWHLSVLVSEAGRSGICEAEIPVEAGSRKASLVWIFSLLPVFLSMLFVLHQKKKSERARPSSTH